MLSRSIITLQELDAVEWFCNVGKKDSDYPLILETWDSAVESCSSEGWERLCQEAANQYASRLAERNKDRFLYWNAIAKEVKKVAIPFVIKKQRRLLKIITFLQFLWMLFSGMYCIFAWKQSFPMSTLLDFLQVKPIGTLKAIFLVAGMVISQKGGLLFSDSEGGRLICRSPGNPPQNQPAEKWPA